MKISTENMMQKWAYVATKAHAGTFRDQCEPQKQFADSGSMLETWVNMFVVHEVKSTNQVNCYTRSIAPKVKWKSFFDWMRFQRSVVFLTLMIKLLPISMGKSTTDYRIATGVISAGNPDLIEANGPTWLSFSCGNLGCPVHVTGCTKIIINQGANGPLLCSAPPRKWRAIPGHPQSPIKEKSDPPAAPGVREGGTINFVQC